ncbi:MAG: hypothetical protein NTZ20_02930 [Candidatus Levybacteria bacterium]|nr:hypothetical protein [Candidatus Levybacteria bacterium]
MRLFLLSTLNTTYEFIRRNSQSGNQLNNLASNEVEYRIPYELIIELPKPRYERNILERDSLGRIIHSAPTPERI